MRSFAAVLFRRIASKTVKKPDPKDLFISLTPEQKTFIRDLLIQCFAEESVDTVRHKIGDAVADIARQFYEYGTSSPPSSGSANRRRGTVAGVAVRPLPSKQVSRSQFPRRCFPHLCNHA